MLHDEYRPSAKEIDRKILMILQRDCRITVEQIARELGVPKSTIHYRIKKLEADNIIEGYHAKVDGSKLGKNFVTVTRVRAKFGPGYHKKMGEELAKIPGVCAVYLVFGENDFIVMTRSSDSNDFMMKLEERLIGLEGIERASSEIVARIIKEDGTIELTAGDCWDVGKNET